MNTKNKTPRISLNEYENQTPDNESRKSKRKEKIAKKNKAKRLVVVVVVV